MRIGLFTESYLPDPNGVATTVAATARELEKLGHTVYIIAPKHPGYKDEKNVIRLYALKVMEKLDMRTALHVPERNLIKIIRLDLDLIHGHAGGTVSFIGWEVARLKNIPYIGTYHTLAHEYTHYILRGKLLTPGFFKTVTRIFGNMCDQLIAPTERAKNELRAMKVSRPIAILPSGIDLETFTNVPKGYLRERLHISDSTKILLYVGRLGREKSMDFLVRAYSDIVKKHPKTALVLVGDGPDKKSLRKLAKELGVSKKVYLPGFIKPNLIPQIYADSDIFVFASKTETQGMVLVEAMASGLPVVAVSDPAFTDLVVNDKNGYLTDRSIEDFSKKVGNILSSEKLYSAMSSASIKMSKKYSVVLHTKNLEKLYEKLLASHKTKEASTFRKTFRGARRVIKLLSEPI